MTPEDELRRALEEMVWQFAFRTVVKGRAALSNGGLSALEDAFDVLGWPDPYFPVDPPVCDIEGCPDWQVAAIRWRGVYTQVCREHSAESRNPDVVPVLKREALEREARRGADGALVPAVRRPELADIIGLVAECTGWTREEITRGGGQRGSIELGYARHLVRFLGREAERSLGEIADALNCHFSSVSAGARTIRLRMAVDPEVQYDVRELRARLERSTGWKSRS